MWKTFLIYQGWGQMLFWELKFWTYLYLYQSIWSNYYYNNNKVKECRKIINKKQWLKRSIKQWRAYMNVLKRNCLASKNRKKLYWAYSWENIINSKNLIKIIKYRVIWNQIYRQLWTVNELNSIKEINLTEIIS